MNAKAGAGVITHSSHTTTNSCQSAKFLSGSKSRRVHCGEFGLWMCSPRPIWEHLKLIMMWSLCMNKYKKIIQTLRRRHTSKHERMDITQENAFAVSKVITPRHQNRAIKTKAAGPHQCYSVLTAIKLICSRNMI